MAQELTQARHRPWFTPEAKVYPSLQMLHNEELVQALQLAPQAEQVKSELTFLIKGSPSHSNSKSWAHLRCSCLDEAALNRL